MELTMVLVDHKTLKDLWVGDVQAVPVTGEHIQIRHPGALRLPDTHYQVVGRRFVVTEYAMQAVLTVRELR